MPTQAGDADDSERDMILKAHCKHVLVTVGEAISVLGEQKKMADTLMKLGARHRERNADTHTFNVSHDAAPHLPSYHNNTHSTPLRGLREILAFETYDCHCYFLDHVPTLHQWHQSVCRR